MVAEEPRHRILNLHLTIIRIVGNHAEIAIVMLIVDRSSGSPGTGMKRRRCRYMVSCNDLKRWQVICMKKLMK